MPNPINVPITPPRVAFIDPRSGNVAREWYMFFLSLFALTSGSSQSLDDVQKGPPPLTVDEINAFIEKASANLQPSTESVVEQIAELQKQINGLQQTVDSCCVNGLAEMQKEVQALQTQPKQLEALLSQLADVISVNPADGDKLIFNGTTGKWTQDSRSYLMIE